MSFPVLSYPTHTRIVKGLLPWCLHPNSWCVHGCSSPCFFLIDMFHYVPLLVYLHSFFPCVHSKKMIRSDFPLDIHHGFPGNRHSVPLRKMIKTWFLHNAIPKRGSGTELRKEIRLRWIPKEPLADVGFRHG